MEKYEHAPKHQRAHLRVHFMHFESPHDVEEFRVDRWLVLEACAHLPYIVTHNAIACRDAASFVLLRKAGDIADRGSRPQTESGGRRSPAGSSCRSLKTRH